MGRKTTNLTGQRFGKLVVVDRAKDHIQQNGRKIIQWLCKCDCGNTAIVRANNLKTGHSKSCGCTNDKHGLSRTRLYPVWYSMKHRCYNPNDKQYKDYGGRGITVCDEWHDLRNFYKCAFANGYDENAEFGICTIERIDTNRNYEPSNCKWVTQKEQANNKRNNHLITYNGKTQSLAQWADEYNIPHGVLERRINRSHWDIEKALNTKIKKENKNNE